MYTAGMISRVFVASVAFASLLSGASPLVGKWKFNSAKSKMTGPSDTVASAGPNTWKFTYGAFSWTVKADGTDQATPFGNTVALKVLSPTAWQFTTKVNGKLMSTDLWELSADGNAMTRSAKGKHENGEGFSDVTRFKRTAGAKGFQGTWQSIDFKGTPPVVDVEAYAGDGVTVLVPADNKKFSVKFDGKEYPVTGPRIPPGMTISAKLENPRKAVAHTMMNGKAFDTETWEVSADGKVFTYTEKDEGQPNAIVGIYDRQ
jgi:hypothetical protein